MSIKKSYAVLLKLQQLFRQRVVYIRGVWLLYSSRIVTAVLNFWQINLQKVSSWPMKSF